jgi:hypothetical protein
VLKEASKACFFEKKQQKIFDYALYACGAVLVLLTILGLTLPQPLIGQFGIGYGIQLDHFVTLACVQGVFYVAAVILLLKTKARATLWPILLVATLMRVPPLLAPPFLSNDMYRYIWDGWVQAAGINPYRYIPANPHLAFLRDTIIYPNINRATYAHTIYPPAAELIFWAVTRLPLPAMFGMKLCLLGFEALGVFAILRLLDTARLPRSRILIYAWNPLPVWEFASSGHVDALTIAFIACALWLAATCRPGRAAGALAAATLTKFLPLILLPALWRRGDWRFAAIFTVVIIALYLPYLSAGTGVFGFLSGYQTQEGIANGSGVFLAQALSLPPAATKTYLIGLAAILIGLAAFMAVSHADPADPRRIAGRFMRLAGVLMLGLSPHYPWYYAWLLIPACILPAPSILYLATFSPLLYLNPTHTKLFWPAFVYGPFIALAIRDLWPRKFPALSGRPLAEGEQT